MLFIATPLGLLLGYPFTSKFHQWFDKRPTLVWGTACWAGGQIIPVVLRIVGWFPDNGSPWLLETLVVIKFVQGLGMAQAAVSFGSMVADIADEHELAMGKRQEGVFFAVVSFANKATTGLGSIIAGIALDAISWPRGANIQHAADVPAETITQLGIVYGPVVAGCGIFALYCYSRYGLTRSIHSDIVSQLAQRKAAARAQITFGRRMMEQFGVVSIFHFVLAVTNFERSLEFYQKIGFKLLRDNRDIVWPDSTATNMGLRKAQGRGSCSASGRGLNTRGWT